MASNKWEDSSNHDLISSRHDALILAFLEIGYTEERSGIVLWLHLKKKKCIWKWRKFLGGHRCPPHEATVFKDRVKRRFRHVLPAKEKTWDNIHNDEFFSILDEEGLRVAEREIPLTG